MFNLIISLIAGILLGRVLRGKIRIDLGRVSFLVTVILIFSLGFTTGSSSDLLNSMPRVGLSAFAISSLTVLFSMFFVRIARKMVKIE